MPWHEIVIGDLFKVTRGYVLPTTAVKGKPQDEYVFPVYSSQTKDEGLMGYYNQYLYENAITWTTDGANAGTVHFRDGKFYCTNVCGVLLNEDGNANRCIAEILGSISKKYVSYVGNPKLMNNVMSEIRIHIPSVAEQKKIDELISALDLRIVKQRELIEHLKKYKRGALQHIFRKMIECSIVTVGDVFTKANKRNSDGRVKNVITNSAEYGLIPQRDFFDKDIAVDGNTNNYFIIKKGCFVYNPRKSNTAPYGPFNCYQGEEEGIISPLYTCLVKKADVDSTYLSWYFKSDSWYRYIYDNGSQGVRHDRVSMTDELLLGIPIKLPSPQKQKEIGEFLNGIDAKLRLESAILDHLIKTKNGLYNKMFL